MTSGGRGSARTWDDVGDLPYRVVWKALSHRPGAHRSRHAGPGGIFRDVVPFLSAPDPRRIDLRQSLRDPWEGLHVRRFEQTAGLDVVLIADVSGSMGFRGHARKMQLLAELVEVLARSAHRVGDRFGLIACDEEVLGELSEPLSRARGGEQDVADRLGAFVPRRAGARGLIEAAQSVAGRRRLVILVSDFRLPAHELTALLDALAPHDVVPIVLEDSSEVADLPSWGLLTLEDLESGRARTVLMRPALKQKLRRAEVERREALRRMLAGQVREPVIVTDRIDWHRLGAALLGAR